MKIIITLIIALGAAVGLALIALEDPGYVVLARDPYTVRMPLALFVLFLLIGFAAAYLLFNFLVGLVRTPKKVRKWRQQSNEQKAQQLTMQGYAGLIEGNWAKAEKKLLGKIQYNRTPLLNYLGAAYAAQQQGHMVRRDRYLDDALASHPGQVMPIKLTRARLHYQAGEVSEARDILEKLREIQPKNIPVTRLLADVYRDLDDWDSLTGLLPRAAKIKAFAPDEQAEREALAFDRRLSSPALLQGDGDRPAAVFKSLPRSKRKDAVVISSYARQLAKSGSPMAAEKQLRTALNRAWEPELAYQYGRLETDFTSDQIKLAHSWERKYGPHLDLTLSLARLYRRDEQPEKAIELFREVIRNGGREEACAELGSLYEDLGDTDAALACYRQGLAALAPDLGLEEPAAVSSGELVALDVDEETDAEVANAEEVVVVGVDTDTDTETETETETESVTDTDSNSERAVAKSTTTDEVMPVVR